MINILKYLLIIHLFYLIQQILCQKNHLKKDQIHKRFYNLLKYKQNYKKLIQSIINHYLNLNYHLHIKRVLKCNKIQFIFWQKNLNSNKVHHQIVLEINQNQLLLNKHIKHMQQIKIVLILNQVENKLLQIFIHYQIIQIKLNLLKLHKELNKMKIIQN